MCRREGSINAPRGMATMKARARLSSRAASAIPATSHHQRLSKLAVFAPLGRTRKKLKRQCVSNAKPANIFRQMVVRRQLHVRIVEWGRMETYQDCPLVPPVLVGSSVQQSRQQVSAPVTPVH